MNLKGNILVLTLSVLMVSSVFTVTLLQPLPGTVIVTFNNSYEERAAVAALRENIGNTIEVQYGTIGYVLAKMRCIESIVFVGHGNSEGIEYRGGLVTDERISSDIKTAIAQDVYVLACRAGGLDDQQCFDDIISFPGLIDAELGALSIATRILLARGLPQNANLVFNRLVDTLESRIFNPKSFMPLYVVYDDGGGGGSPSPYLSSSELTNFIAVLAIGVLIGIICVSAVAYFSSYFASAATEASVLAVPTYRELFKALMISIAINGAKAASTCINTVFGGSWNMAFALESTVSKTLDIAINKMNAAEYLIFIGLTALETILLILTGGYGFVVRVAAAISVATINAAVIAVADYYDSDGTPCMSAFEAISQIFA